MRASAVSTRRSRSVESVACAAKDIGTIEPGMSLFAVTRGQWSMIDAILHCLEQVGEARVSLWTWTIAEYEISAMANLMSDGRVTAARLVIDGGARKKNAHLIAAWKDKFGPASVRYVRNHAKIASIESSSGLRLLLRGSMNLNYNPRFEQFDLTEGGQEFDLVRRIEDELPVLEDDAGDDEVYAATRLRDAWTEANLKTFRPGIKVWAK